MNFILRIYVPSTLNVASQYTEVLIVALNQRNLHFMIRFIILSGLRVDVNRNCEIYYSFDSC